MGCLECDRPYCDNVMCEFMYAGKYICSDCLDEFRQYMSQTRETRYVWANCLIAFMETDKGHTKRPIEPGTMTVDEFIDTYVTNRLG